MRTFETVIAFIGSGVLATAQTGSIQGTVANGQGSPIKGAVVSYHRLATYVSAAPQPFAAGQQSSAGTPRLAPGEIPIDRAVTTDALGGHKSGLLVAGTYTLCVDVPGQPYLDPCRWSTAPSASVSENRISTLNVVIQKGVYVRIRVNDPQRLLPSSEKHPLDFPHLTAGVFFGTGAFQAAQRSAVDSGGQDYSLAVPMRTPLTLWIFSRDVALSGDSGVTFSGTGAKVAFQADNGQDKQFTIGVVGPATTAN